jgi:hypothetical protein
MRRWLPLALALALVASTAYAEPAKHRSRHKRPQLTAEGSPAELAKAKKEAEKAEAAPPPVAAEPPVASTSQSPPTSTSTGSPAAGNPDVKVTTKLDKRELKVGELAKLQIVVEAPSSMEPTLPEQSFGGLELVDRQLKTEVQGARTRTTYELDLLALSAGDANIPALNLRLVGQNGELSSASTDAQSVRVSSLIANEPNAEPKPASKPLSVMQDDYTIAWVALALLAIALIAGATLLIARWVKRRPKPVLPPPPPRPPWELARERLEQLAQARETLFAAQQGEQFVDGVSDAIREYLGRRYGFDGLERTTHELMIILEKLRPHALKLAAVSTLLDECDLVKFARMAPDADRAQELWDGAMQLVKATTPTGTSLPPMQLPEAAR